MSLSDEEELDMLLDMESDNEEENIFGYCCGQKMEKRDDNSIVCGICQSIDTYIDDMFVKPHSNTVSYDANGKMVYGQNVKKTMDDKTRDLVEEYQNMLNRNKDFTMDTCYIKGICRNIIKIFDGRIYKKERRKQIFAAVTYLYMISRGVLYTTKELVSMFGTETAGIGVGLGFIYKYNSRHDDLEFAVDPIMHHQILEKKLAVMIYPCMEGDKVVNKSLLCKNNLLFCNMLVEFMLENNVAYNTDINTKCAGAIFYLTNRMKLKTKKKKDIKDTLQISQNTMIKIYNVLLSSEIQLLLPKILRMP